MSAPYANLRQGLLGAWCPSLVSSGGRRLRDLGPLRADAIFTGGFNAATVYEASGDGLAWRMIPDNSNIAYWDVPTTNLQNIPVTWSACCWARANATQVVSDFAFMSHMATGVPFNGWMLLSDATSVFAYINAGTRVTASSVVVRERWQHFGITSDGTTVRVFVDGRQRASGAYSTAPTVAGVPLRFGLYGTNRMYTGLLDDMRYYSRTLAPSEMMALASRRGIGLLPQRSRRASVGGARFHLNAGGTWKAAATWIKVGGVWTKATPKINVGGTWK